MQTARPRGPAGYVQHGPSNAIAVTRFPPEIFSTRSIRKPARCGLPRWARGGDQLNAPEPGRNYGQPLVSYAESPTLRTHSPRPVAPRHAAVAGLCAQSLTAQLQAAHA